METNSKRRGYARFAKLAEKLKTVTNLAKDLWFWYSVVKPIVSTLLQSGRNMYDTFAPLIVKIWELLRLFLD